MHPDPSPPDGHLLGLDAAPAPTRPMARGEHRREVRDPERPRLAPAAITGGPPVAGEHPGRPFTGRNRRTGKLRAEARRGDRHRGARRGAAGVVQLGEVRREGHVVELATVDGLFAALCWKYYRDGADMSTDHDVAPVSVYLQECLQRQGVVAKELFRRPQNLRRIEEEVSKIESTSLVYDHIEPIMKIEPWGEQQFWQWPSPEEYETRRGSMPIVLWNIRSNRNREKDKTIVEELLRVFLHIEPVSVLMRFLAPDRFGILSPPVEKLLEISPSSSPTEKYLSYIQDLRVIKDKRNFERVADVDMAIWTLQQAIDHPDRVNSVAPEGKGWRKAYYNDRLLREIRVQNLTRSLFSNMELADVAEALAADYRHDRTDDHGKLFQLAGQIAGIQFERAVMEVAKKTITRYKGRTTCADYADDVKKVYKRRKDRLWRMVDKTLKLPERVRDDWRSAVGLRNKAVHDAKPLEKPELARLLQIMRNAMEHGATDP